MLEEVLGSKHPLTAYTQANLADFLRLTGRLTEAIPFAKQAHGHLRQALPKEHRYVRWARKVLGEVRKD
jgi:hypothetical protein